MRPVKAVQMVKLFRVTRQIVELFLTGEGGREAHLFEDRECFRADLPERVVGVQPRRFS